MDLPRCAIIDGGTGTELSSYGVDTDPLWSARLLSTNTDAIRDVHLKYLEAGADIIETVTYQATVDGFKKYLDVDETGALHLLLTAVHLAKEVRDTFWTNNPKLHEVRRYPLVAGSVGPYGAWLADGSEYSGAYVETTTQEELRSWHRPKIKALLEASVDVLAIETIPAQAEAEAIVELLTEFPDCKAWLCYSYKDEKHTSHGELLKNAVQALTHSKQLMGIGVNCGSPTYVERIIMDIKPIIGDKMLVILPNSGEEWTENKRWIRTKEAQNLESLVARWWMLGARWIGGCCRIGPHDIALIRHTIQQIDPSALNP